MPRNAGDSRLVARFRRLERLTAVTTHPADSVGRVVSKRARVLAECLAREALTLPYRRSALKPLKTVRGTKRSTSALVLGNGPSVKSLDWDAVRRAQSNGLELIVVNWFPLTPRGQEMTPDVLVLSDPTMGPDRGVDPRNQRLWEFVRAHPSVRLAVPVSWFPSVSRIGDLLPRTWFFDDASLEGWTSSSSPLRPRGYLSLTVYKALGIALFLGYERINVLGVDNTMFRGLRVDTENHIHLEDHHFYEKAREDQDLSWFCPNGVADYFYDLSLCFLHLRRSFGGHTNIVNLDPDSLVDCFPKDGDSGLTLS